MLFELFVKVLANILVAVSIGILAIILVLPLLGIFAWFDELKRKRKVRKKEQALESMLSGRSLETVLEKSPYKHILLFQGDNYYRIYDNRNQYDDQNKPIFIDWVANTLDAHLWIVERYSSEQAEVAKRAREKSGSAHPLMKAQNGDKHDGIDREPNS